MEKIINIIENNKCVLVHCLGGKGRTAMVIFCYLKTKGYINDEIYNILNTRTTLITSVQEEFIKNNDWKNY